MLYPSGFGPKPATRIVGHQRDSFIKDQLLYFRWHAIKKHMTQPRGYVLLEQNGQLLIRDFNCYIAKHSNKMRLYSQLDWCHYEPSTLAQAIESNTLDQYYEIMLLDNRSDPNIWQRPDQEHILKVHYAARGGRASKL